MASRRANRTQWMQPVQARPSDGRWPVRAVAAPASRSIGIDHRSPDERQTARPPICRFLGCRRGKRGTRVRPARPPSCTAPAARPLQRVAERVGFEPTDLAVSGFQDRRNRPLCHLSGAARDECSRTPCVAACVRARDLRNALVDRRGERSPIERRAEPGPPQRSADLLLYRSGTKRTADARPGGSSHGPFADRWSV